MTVKTSSSQEDTALTDFDRLPDAAFVRVQTVAGLYASSEATIWRWVKQGLVPAPRKLGPQKVAWNVGELRRALSGPSKVA